MQRLLAAYRFTSSTASVVLLIAANLLPLVGVLAWGWDLMAILVLYWIENGIVGVYNVLKMLRAEGTSLPGVGGLRVNGRAVSQLAKGPLTGFFIVHYGFFWLGHGLFVLLFLPLIAGIGAGFEPAPDGGLSPFGPGATPDWDLVGLGAVGLAISHGTSFWLNYIGRGEYRSMSAGRLMLAPYGRLVILHMTILLGGVVSATLGSPVGSLVVLVGLKTAMDLYFHLREHRAVAAREPVPTSA